MDLRRILTLLGIEFTSFAQVYTYFGSWKNFCTNHFLFAVQSTLLKLSWQIAQDLLELRSGEFCGYAKQIFVVR